MIELFKDMSVKKIPPFFMFGLAFILFFTPADYVLPPTFDHAWDVVAIACSWYFIFLMLRRYGASPMWICFSLFFIFFYFVSCIWNHTDLPLTNVFFKLSKGVGFLSLVIYGMKRDPKGCIEGFLCAGFVMCAINFITYVIYRDIVGGMQHGVMSWQGHLEYQRWYFFSSDNGSLFYYLPVAAAAHYYAMTYNHKFSLMAWLFTAITLYMYIDLKSTAAMVSFGLFSLFALIIVICQKKWGCRKMRLPSFPLMLLLGVIFNLFIIGFLSSDLLLGLFNDFFGKSSSLLERIEIWSKALGYYSNNPIFGVGLSLPETDIARITYNHTHNILLQIVYQGGAVSLLLFFAGCFFCYKGRGAEESHPASIYLIISIFALFIAGTFDFYFHYTPLFFPLFAYGCLDSQRDSGPACRESTDSEGLENDGRACR